MQFSTKLSKGHYLIFLFCVSCSFSTSKIEYERGQNFLEKKDFKSAFDAFKKVYDLEGDSELGLKAAKETARIAHFEAHQYKEAATIYKKLLLGQRNEAERLVTLRTLADLYFIQLADYKSAIETYNTLLSLPHSKEDTFLFQLNIAKSYFYMNNFFQADIELEKLINQNADSGQMFEPLLLKANIYLTSKELDQAIVALKKLLLLFPEKAKKENIGTILAVTYEEKKDFANAIAVLESMKGYYSNRVFLERRIKALRERQLLQPGAKGLRK